MDNPKIKLTADGIELDSPTDEDEFRYKLIEELHEINLSLRRLSGRDVEEEKPQTYKDFYFGQSE